MSSPWWRLYRPGPLGSGMIDDFIQRKHGKAKVEYLLPELEADSARDLRDYRLSGTGDADRQHHRRLLAWGMPICCGAPWARKSPRSWPSSARVFLKGAVEHGFDQKKAEEIFELMAYFAGYGFNKSHSAAYALIAYWTAYLKVALSAGIYGSPAHQRGAEHR